jgi:hypothetical protein
MVALYVSGLLAAMANSARAIPNLATTVLLTDYVNKTGARCLDGSPQRYWLQKSATGSSKWAIHLMGGGWCESISDCAARAYSWHCYIGSSDPRCFSRQQGDMPPWENYSATMDFTDIPSILGARWGGGFMINDPARNTIGADWNRVEISYCSGDGHVGSSDNVTYVTFNGTSNLPLYFRGGRNVAAAFDHLILTQGLGSADEVLLSGDSAGGLACYSHADSLRALLPQARVLAAPDSGFFYAYDLYPSWPRALVQFVAANGNATAFLNQACVAAQLAAGHDPLECILPEVAAPFISTPLFVMNSKYDPALFQIIAGESGKNATNVNRIGAQLLERINATVLSNNTNAAINALFAPSCTEHCGQWGTNQTGLFPDYNPTIDDATGIQAFAQWRDSLPPSTWPAGSRGRADAERAWGASPPRAPQRVWIQGATFPCANCCNGGQA